jgi:hypothetical protein
MVRFAPDQMCWSEKYCFENETHHDEHAGNKLVDSNEYRQLIEFVVLLQSVKWRDVEVVRSPLVGDARRAKNLRV